MSILELEQAKATIAASDVTEVMELASALEARLASLGLAYPIQPAPDDEAIDIAPELRQPFSWEELDAELVRHENGAASYGREDLEKLREHYASKSSSSLVQP